MPSCTGGYNPIVIINYTLVKGTRNPTDKNPKALNCLQKCPITPGGVVGTRMARGLVTLFRSSINLNPFSPKSMNPYMLNPKPFSPEFLNLCPLNPKIPPSPESPGSKIPGSTTPKYRVPQNGTWGLPFPHSDIDASFDFTLPTSFW